MYFQLDEKCNYFIKIEKTENIHAYDLNVAGSLIVWLSENNVFH